MCPICLSLISATEEDLVSHLLARHPAEASALGLAVTLANIALAKRPAWLLALDLCVLGAAFWFRRGYPSS